MEMSNIIHYSGHGVLGMLPGWPVCGSGDFAFKVRAQGNHTEYVNSVSCKRCIKKMKKHEILQLTEKTPTNNQTNEGE